MIEVEKQDPKYRIKNGQFYYTSELSMAELIAVMNAIQKFISKKSK